MRPSKDKRRRSTVLTAGTDCVPVGAVLVVLGTGGAGPARCWWCSHCCWCEPRGVVAAAGWPWRIVSRGCCGLRLWTPRRWITLCSDEAGGGASAGRRMVAPMVRRLPRD